MSDENDPLAEVPDWLRAELGTLAVVDPPPALADRVRAAACAARSPGRPANATIDRPVDGFTAVVRDLGTLLDTLAGSEWLAPTVYPSWSVRDLVVHMVAVERYAASSMGFDDFLVPDGTESDHLGIAADLIVEFRGRPVTDAVAEWRRVTERSVEWLGSAATTEALEAPVPFHGLTPRLSSLLVIRMFEIWTHADDIRRAVGRAPEAPEPGQLALMTELAVRSIPLALAMSARSIEGRTARIVLTGPGGGAWTQPLGLAMSEPGPIDVSLVADAVDFCRLAARRLAVSELVCEVVGDRSLAGDVLVGAAVFAA